MRDFVRMFAVPRPAAEASLGKGQGGRKLVSLSMDERLNASIFLQRGRPVAPASGCPPGQTVTPIPRAIFYSIVYRGGTRRGRPAIGRAAPRPSPAATVGDGCSLSFRLAVVLTHDISTLAGHAFERVDAGHPMPGIFAVRSQGPVGAAIEDLLLLAECSLDREWEGQVRLPL